MSIGPFTLNPKLQVHNYWALGGFGGRLSELRIGGGPGAGGLEGLFGPWGLRVYSLRCVFLFVSGVRLCFDHHDHHQHPHPHHHRRLQNLDVLDGCLRGLKLIGLCCLVYDPYAMNPLRCSTFLSVMDFEFSDGCLPYSPSASLNPNP